MDFKKKAEEIKLDRGVALIDADDYEKVSAYNWHLMSKGYVRSWRREGKRQICILMHRFILNAPNGSMVDHINCNRLDNRKANLRFCTPSQNIMNRSKGSGCLSKYKGVFLGKRCRSWTAKIKREYIGYFDSEEDAAKAYDKRAVELFGEFAKLNFPILELKVKTD